MLVPKTLGFSKNLALVDTISKWFRTHRVENWWGGSISIDALVYTPDHR